MGTHQGQMHCATCCRMTLATKATRVNHVLHLLITLLLCGCWAPMWLLFTLGDNAPFRGSVAATAPALPTSRGTRGLTTNQWLMIVGSILLALCGAAFFLLLLLANL